VIRARSCAGSCRRRRRRSLDEEVDQRRREGQREVVAAALDQHDVAVGKRASMSSTAARFMLGSSRTPCATRAGLDAEDAFLEQMPSACAGRAWHPRSSRRLGDDEDLDAHLESGGVMPRRSPSCPSRRGADPDSRYLLHVHILRGLASVHEQAHVRPDVDGGEDLGERRESGHVVEVAAAAVL